jgi:drug/metabolite transporter (DMT)-like permease
VPYIFLVYGAAALVLIAIMLGLGKTPLGYPPVAYLWFFLLAVFPQLVGHTSFNWALRYLPASFVSVVLLGEPIGSSILAYVIFSEQPGLIMIGGATFIMVGIWLSARSSGSR